jgi:large subunit ribosomal protein L5
MASVPGILSPLMNKLISFKGKSMTALPRLQKLYRDEFVGKLKTRLHTKFPPQLSKIVLNMGLGKAATNKKLLEAAIADMSAIAGQKAILTTAKQSNAGFSVRKGWPIGCKVTLRRQRMYEFLDRLLNIAIPRIRDFRGFPPQAFDGRGNYTLGIREHVVFPECDMAQEVTGLDITFVTTAHTDEAAFVLLSVFNFPFKIRAKEQ